MLESEFELELEPKLELDQYVRQLGKLQDKASFSPSLPGRCLIAQDPAIGSLRPSMVILPGKVEDLMWPL